MQSRREVVLGGLLTVGFMPRCACAQSQTLGCVISDQHLVGVLGSRPATFSFNVDNDAVENGSGNKDFDRALAITLAKLSDLLGILPGFAFFNEGTEGQNAFASRSRRLGRDDGSVVFGQVMFGKLMQSRDSPELGVAAVCSHEFGHILQFKMDLQNRLVGPDGRVKRLELHADYLAGYFAGLRKRERADFPAAIFAQTQYNFGDTAYARADHHGTPDERGQAVVAGFQAAYRDRKSLSAAIEEGIRYVGTT
jgi:hypothetical protein